MSETETFSLNGEVCPLPRGAIVASVIDVLGRGRAGIAVARNGAVVPRSAWEDTVLAPGDRVEIVTVTAGG